MSKPFRIDLTGAKNQIEEKTRRRITFDVLDDEEQTIAGVSLNFMNLFLYNEADGATINGRTGLDVLGSQITVDGSGKGVLLLDPDDNPIVGTDPIPDQEVHVAHIDYQWDADAVKVGRAIIRLLVVNLLKTN